MTLLQLSYYAEVCRTKNFTRAAENLNVTQPTITNAVRDLEQEFGLKLMERDKKHLILTETGEELLDMALQLLDYADYIQLVMQDRAEEKRRLLLGVPNMTHAAGFPDFFRLLHRSYPDMEIQTVHDITVNLMPELCSGRLHMLMVPYKPKEAQCRYLVWKKTRFLFCVPAGHPLADRGTVRIEDICHEPLISHFGDIYLQNYDLRRRYLELGAEMNIVYRCDQINMMHELIRSGEGCGFLIEGTFMEEGIVGLALEEELPVTLYLVWTKESERYAVVKKVLQKVREYQNSGGENQL